MFKLRKSSISDSLKDVLDQVIQYYYVSKLLKKYKICLSAIFIYKQHSYRL